MARITIKGLPIELDTKELIELIKSMDEKTPARQEQAVIVRRGKYKRHGKAKYDLTPEEIQHVIKAYKTSNDSLKACCKKLDVYYSKKSLKKITRVMRKQGIKYVLRKNLNMTRASAGVNDQRTKRFKFMNERANALMRQNNWSRSKAQAQAALEWMQHGRVQHVRVKPQIVHDDQKNDVLLQILHRASGTGEKVTRKLEGYTIDDLGPQEWRDLTQKILSMSEEISVYLNLRNKFKLKFLGSEPYIVYER